MGNQTMIASADSGNDNAIQEFQYKIEKLRDFHKKHFIRMCFRMKKNEGKEDIERNEEAECLKDYFCEINESLKYLSHELEMNKTMENYISVTERYQTIISSEEYSKKKQKLIQMREEMIEKEVEENKVEKNEIDDQKDLQPKVEVAEEDDELLELMRALEDDFDKKEKNVEEKIVTTITNTENNRLDPEYLDDEEGLNF